MSLVWRHAFKSHFPDFSGSPLLKNVLSTGYFAVVFHYSLLLHFNIKKKKSYIRCMYLSVLGGRRMPDSIPCFNLLTNYFVEEGQNSQYIDESAGIRGRSDRVMKSVKGMMWLAFSRQKKLSSHVELVLYSQPLIGNIPTTSHLDPEFCFKCFGLGDLW